MNVPLLDLKAQYQEIREEIKLAVDEVLESQHFILGPKVQELEERIARYCGTKYAVGVASGSDALLLALMALSVGSGDEVITTPYTFFATAGSISRLKATPVFVDIDPVTYNINPALIEEKITPQTKAIIPVHLFGQCADMDPICKLARQNNCAVIEDAAQAIGAQYKGKMAGSMGDFAVLSFFPSKNLGGYGDGGMVLTNDPLMAEKVRILRVHGSKPKYYHHTIGVSSRLDALQAAVLLVKLKYLNQWTAKRRGNASRYDQLFKDLEIAIPLEQQDHHHIYNQYVIRLKERDRLKQYLTEHHIATEIYYPLSLHLQKCYQDLRYKEGDFPESERASQQTLGLPIYPELTASQQEFVVNSVADFLKNSPLNPSSAVRN